MCGISGIYALTSDGRQQLRNIERMNNTLKKRGPDGGNVCVKDRAAIGHRRLSVIDVSSAGDQPMHSHDGRYSLIFNGEIFNYQELRDKYLSEKEKQDLRSHSDSEVFLQLYSKMKQDVFLLLRGFFAAAIYDNETEELVIVRDRYGKKPLLYFSDNDNFSFASEIKALLEYGIPRELDWNVLSLYLQLNYIPEPYSIIKNVRKLEPGHYLLINKDGHILNKPYYNLKLHPEAYPTYTYDAAQEKLTQLLDESVRLRLIADVPLGAFLSGGIDSSVVVALASRHVSRLNTFSVGYKDNPFFDETKYANLVAKKYNTNHTVFSLTNNDFLEHIDNVLDSIDEPFADSSAIPVFILSSYTRKHVTVALSGDGGDEVFAGYNKHGAEWRARKGGLANSLVKAGHPLWSMLPKSRNGKLTNKIRQLHRFSSGTRLSAADRYWRWASLQTSDQAYTLLSDEVRSKVVSETVKRIKLEYTQEIKGEDFNEVLLADMNLVLLSDMLPKVDIMSMANSLEIRSPFLDQEVVEFSFGLPAEYKIDGSMKKRIVQDAFRPLLPEELYNRPKQGFEIPLLSWFRNELWSKIDNDLLSDSFISEQKIFNLTSIQNLKKKLHSSNPEDAHATIWALMVFQYWWKKNIA